MMRRATGLANRHVNGCIICASLALGVSTDCCWLCTVLLLLLLLHALYKHRTAIDASIHLHHTRMQLFLYVQMPLLLTMQP
jgi:hypothetical protein